MLLPLLALKFAIYSFWCGVGLWISEGPAAAGESLVNQALCYGVLRLIIGIAFFGYLFSILLGGGSMTAFFWGAPVVRLLEWSIMLMVFRTKRNRPPVGG